MEPIPFFQPSFLNCIERCGELEQWCRSQSPFDPACIGVASRCISQCFDQTFSNDMVVAAAEGFARGLVRGGAGGKPFGRFSRPPAVEYPLALSAHTQDGTMLRLALRGGAYDSIEGKGTIVSPRTSYVHDVNLLVEGSFLELLESHIRQNPELLSAEKAKLSFRKIVGELKASHGSIPPDIEVTVDHVDSRRLSSGGYITSEGSPNIRFLFSAAESFPGVFPPPDEAPPTAEAGAGNLLGSVLKGLVRIGGGAIGFGLVYAGTCVAVSVTEGCQDEAAQTCGGGDNVRSVSSRTSFGVLGCSRKCDIQCK